MKCCRHLTTLLVGVAMLAGLVGSTPRSAGAASCGAGSSPTTGLVRDAHPVVLVHGWTGGVMQATRTKLEAKIGKGWQFLLFDYHGASALWASSPRIAGCLATYLKAVSDAHVKAGGDGMVYVVAHSMGGLALRFAADPRYGKIAGLADHIGGLVTLATPHRGTPWGNSGVYVQLANLKNTLLLDAAPKGQEATRCLAPQDAGGGLPAGCDAPPYLPLKVRIDQIAGAATVRRTFFGLHAYDILLGGDSIVPQLSAQGYLRSAQGSTVGMSARSTQVSCAIDADAFGAVLGGGVLGTIARLKIDGAAMDAIQGDRTSPALLEFLLAANTAMPCSHVGITKFDAAIDQTVTALRNDAKARQGVDALASLAAAGRRQCLARRFANDSLGCTRPPEARISKLDPRYGWSGPPADAYGGAMFRRTSPSSASWAVAFELGGGGVPCEAIAGVPERVVAELGVCYGFYAFATPSRNIGCYISIDWPGEARCDIAEHEWVAPTRPPSCSLNNDWGYGVEVTPHGTGFVCATDSANNDRVVPYGTTTRGGPFTCVVSETGVRCTYDPTGHGFEVSRSAYRFF